MSAAADARLYRRRLKARRTTGACLAGCGRQAVAKHRYCRRCGAARVLSQRARLAQQPRSDSVPGRESVYLPQGLR